MIEEIRNLQARLAALQRSLQRPTQEIRDDGTLRVRIGRHPGGSYTVSVYDAGGVLVADLVALEARVTALEGP